MLGNWSNCAFLSLNINKLAFAGEPPGRKMTADHCGPQIERERRERDRETETETERERERNDLVANPK